MERNYTIKTAPASEPVTTAEAKLYARIPHAIEDALVDTWIEAGRKLAEDYQHRSYITQVWQMVLDRFPCTPFDFPRPPLITLDSVKYYDTDEAETTYASTNYQVDIISEPGRFSLAYNILWPSVVLRNLNGVIFEFTTGYGAASDVPKTLKDAIYLYCAYRYENRTAEEDGIPDTFYHILDPDRIAVY